MEKERRLTLVAVAAVVIAAAVTYFYTPSGTSIPIPEPANNAGNEGLSSGLQVVADNLEVPWAIDIADDGRIFFTERPGRIRIIDAAGSLLESPAAYINAEQRGEAGLLGLVLHPDFSSNHLLYVYHTYSDGTAVYNKVLMLTEKDNKIIESKVILDGIPAADRNDGGRLKFGPDGKLYISTGDVKQPDLAQNAKSLAGKLLRINPDGSIPEGNPFPGSPVYAFGFRNVQGMAWDPVTKEMYVSDHGESGNDEINLVKAGENYGWPIEECDAKSFEKPVVCYNPAIAPAGMTFASSDRLGYGNDLVVTSLRAKQLRLVDLESGAESNILTSYGRLRDVIEAKDGTLYVLTSNRDGRAIADPGDDKILRVSSP
ncbi:MAG: glucose dehydrogenase [Nitrososphaera sp.]|nr:glucose dehydrogenase [Nitrososphaera sp.]